MGISNSIVEYSPQQPPRPKESPMLPFGLRTCLVLLLFGAAIIASTSITGAGAAAHARTRKIVLIAGSMTGHDKQTHEYEKNVILLKQLLDTAKNVKGIQTEACFHGWPEDEKTLDDADAIVFVTDGSDRNEQDHPLFVGDRMKVIEKQVRRGCGLMMFHWSTFAPVKYDREITDWVGGYFDYETGSAANHWRSAIQTYK